jgi:hypothetical protein
MVALRTSLLILALAVLPAATSAQPRHDLGPPWAFVEIVTGSDHLVPDAAGACQPADELPITVGVPVTLADETGAQRATAGLQFLTDINYDGQEFEPTATPITLGPGVGCWVGVLLTQVPISGGYDVKIGGGGYTRRSSEMDDTFVRVSFVARPGDYRTWHDDDGDARCDVLAESPIRTGAFGELWPIPDDDDDEGDPLPTPIFSSDTGRSCVLHALFPVPSEVWQERTSNLDERGAVHLRFGLETS